jgi:fatty acid/phospholipid biosynthesis enzyme
LLAYCAGMLSTAMLTCHLNAQVDTSTSLRSRLKRKAEDALLSLSGAARTVKQRVIDAATSAGTTALITAAVTAGELEF